MDGAGYCLSFNSNYIELELSDGTNSGTFTSAQGVPTDNEWHFVAITVDRSLTNGIKYYVDGVQQIITKNPTAVSNSISNNGNLYIGKHPNLGHFFSSELDEIELFNEALSQVSIERIYTAGGAGKCNNVAYAPSVVGYCASQTTLSIGITICNYSNSQRTYSLQDLAGLPAGTNGGNCNVDGPTNYNDISGSLTLNGGHCGIYMIEITKPASMTSPFDRACYQASFQDDTGNTFWTEGSVLDLSALCLVVQSNGNPLESIILSPKQRKNLTLILQNSSEQAMEGRISLADPKEENLMITSKNGKFLLNSFSIPAKTSLEVPLTIESKVFRSFKGQSLKVEVRSQEDQHFEVIREINVSSQR